LESSFAQLTGSRVKLSWAWRHSVRPTLRRQAEPEKMLQERRNDVCVLPSVHSLNPASFVANRS